MHDRGESVVLVGRVVHCANRTVGLYHCVLSWEAVKCNDETELKCDICSGKD